MKIIDCHTHINKAFYKEDRDEVIERALKKGVGIINIGTNLEDSKENMEIAGLYEGVWATVGLHPTEREDFNYESFLKLAQREEVVAIGECGLDYFREENQSGKERKRQEKIFRGQIKLAGEVKKPLMLHLRTGEAYEEAIRILGEKNKLEKVIFHFFVGLKEQLRRIRELPFKTYFTFGGVITFARDYDEVIKEIPVDMILLETDAPFLAPKPYRGKRNEPAYILETAKKMAELKGIKEEELFVQLEKNAKKVFGI